MAEPSSVEQNDQRAGRILIYLADLNESAQIAETLRDTYDVAVCDSDAMGVVLAEAVPFDVAVLAASHVSGFGPVRRRHGLPIVVAMDPEAVSDDPAEQELATAEDFIVRPITPSELKRRIRALIEGRRGSADAPRDVTGPDGIVVRPAAHELIVGAQAIRLRPLESAVLRVLLEHRGEVVSVDTLLDEVWGPERASRNLVEAQVSRIRAKLRDTEASGLITTVHGVGYLVR